MGLLKKVVLGLIAVVLAFVVLGFVFGGIALYQIVTPPAKFEVKSIAIADHDGYPAVKIAFETSKYPVSFYLLSPEGEKIDGEMASEPEKVAYLHLTPFKPYTNVVGERSYIVKAYYSNTEIWTKNITIKGVKPEVKLVNISTNSDLLGLSINGITLKVKNSGDTPLYLTTIPDNVKAYLDGKGITFTLEKTVVLPGEEKAADLGAIICQIGYEDIDREHTLQIDISGFKTDYTIPPAKVTLNIGKLGFGEFLGTKYLDNATVTVANGWTFPFNVKWIKILVNGKDYSSIFSWIPETKNVVKSGETAAYTLKFPLSTAGVGSKVEFYIGETRIATMEVTSPS